MTILIVALWFQNDPTMVSQWRDNNNSDYMVLQWCHNKIGSTLVVQLCLNGYRMVPQW